MLMSDTRAWLEIDLSKISHNVKEIQKLLPSTSKIMAIVKANAYGHGDVACAKELSRCGIDFFGVSSVDEGISLREGGIREPILILGYTPPVHFHQVIQHDLIQTFLSLDHPAARCSGTAPASPPGQTGRKTATSPCRRHSRPPENTPKRQPQAGVRKWSVPKVPKTKYN